MSYYTKYTSLLDQLVSCPPEKKKQLVSQIREARQRADQEYLTWVHHVENQWEPGEWEAIKLKLENLSLEELRELTTKVGIVFTGGNEQIKDKQEFILVLDEAEKDLLNTELRNY